MEQKTKKQNIHPNIQKGIKPWYKRTRLIVLLTLLTTIIIFSTWFYLTINKPALIERRQNENTFSNGKCSSFGETIPVPNENCCPGLKGIGAYTITPEGKCSPYWGGLLKCVPCGNNICEAKFGENKCNCPEDCK